MPDIKVFTEDGDTTLVSQQTPLNDLTKAPKYHDSLPEGMTYIPIVVPAKDGSTPRLALANPELIATTQEVIDKISTAVGEARQQFVDAGIERDQLQQEQIDELNALQAQVQDILEQQASNIAMLQSHDAILDQKDTTLSSMIGQLQTLVAQLQQKVAMTKIGDATISFSATLAVGAGSRSIVVNLTGVKKGDKLSLYPTATLPNGYSLSAGVISDTNKFTVTVTHPALVLGASFSIPVEVWALR